MHPPSATIGRLRAEARSVTAKGAVRELLGAFERNDLLTAASAIAFQVLFALVPFLLFMLGLLGGLELEELYRRKLAPKLEETATPAAYAVIDDTVQKVLGGRQLFWITIGAVITVWEMSGAARAVMGAFDRIYECEDRRGFVQRYVRSIWLALAAGLLMLAAFAVFAVLPELVDGVAMSILRWPLTAALLFLTVALFVRYAPAGRQPLDWVSFGAILVVVAWLGTSVGFAFYVRTFADYGSIFGALATVIILMTYLYLAAVAFLAGAQVDALVRRRLDER